MAKEQVELKTKDSILDELERVHEKIAQRAYDLFRNHEDLFIEPLDDWFRAERELLWRPAVELRQSDGAFELEAALAGMEPKDVDVQVTPEDVLITASSQHRHEEKKGTVHLCEFDSGRLFRSVHLPERIDPDSAKAEFRNGLLRVTATVAKTAVASAPREVIVHAA